mgnify:CR=1 FL=1
MEQYMAILRKNYDAQEVYIKEMRGLKHDIQAHMIVLQYYLEEGSYDRAKAYLRQMQKHQEKVKRLYIDTGNNMINAVLTERWKQSEAEIEVSCFGEIPMETGGMEYELCTIFSNLFSNAIEACEKLKIKKKRIEIEIEQKPDSWCVTMRNPIEWVVDKEILGKGTSKPDKKEHGYGLSNVKRTVKEMGGRIELFMEREYFEAKISLPNLSESAEKSLLFLSKSDGI